MKRAILALLLAAILIPAALADSDTVEFNYSGTVRVQGTPFDGPGQFKFSIVSRNGLTTYWANDGITLDGNEPTTSTQLTVTAGFFSVNIGDSTTPGMAKLDPSVFNASDRVFLRVWFSDGTHGFEKLTPDRGIVNPALLGSQPSKRALDLYVNGTTGNDSFNGFTAGSAKKTIQAALNMLPARIDSNATVHIAAGVYREAPKLYGITVNPDSALTIVGDPTTVPTTSVDPNVRITGSDNDVTNVRGLAMAVVNCTGFTIKGILFDRCTAYGLTCRYSAGTFLNCKSKLNTLDGFECEQGETNFSNCVSQDNGRYGFQLVKFTASLFTSTTAYHNSSDGVFLQQSLLQLIGGTFQLNQRNGLNLTDQSTLRMLTGASITFNSQFGIHASSASITANNAANTFSSNTLGSTTLDTGGGIF